MYMGNPAQIIRLFPPFRGPLRVIHFNMRDPTAENTVDSQIELR